MQQSLGKYVLALVLLVGCGDGERFVLKVTFPDTAARDQAKKLWVAVVGPGAEHGCDELKQGQAVPGDAGFSIEGEVFFDWPAAGKIRGLGDVSAGRRLFYAQAEDENTKVFLRGCTDVEVGEEESREVTIALEWVSKPCAVDGDCGDSNDCTSDRCEEGNCVNEPVADGTECGLRTCIGLVWMQPTCVSGECSGSEAAADCEDGSDCTLDSCDDLDGCDNAPLMAGTDCGVCSACDGQGVCIDDLTQDGDCPVCQECRPEGTCLYQAAGSDVKGECTNDIFCDGAETCNGSGGCQAGSDPCPDLNCNEDNDSCEGCLADTDCPPCQECDAGDCVNQAGGSDTKDDCAADACNTGACDGAGACGLEGAGTACDDGESCSALDACDGAGVCVSGATDKDTDGDSYYDEACPGGDDCDDDAISVNPGATEGPVGDATCSDLADNDCDGSTDADDPECSDWWDPAFGSRIKLIFDNSAQNEDLTDFPVRVSLDATRIDYAGTMDAGEDLRFVDADGVTVLPHEIEVWDETGTSEVWVRVPRIDASAGDDFIWMYFDSPGSADGQNTAGVWEPDFVGVWHLADADSAVGTILDSTSSANNGTVSGGPTFEVAGKIGKAVGFDGIDDYATLGNAGFNPSAGTVEAWVKLDAIPPLDKGYVFSHFIPSPPTSRTYIYIQTSGVWGTGMGSSVELVEGSPLDVDLWTYLVLAWDGTDARGYLNASLDLGPTPYADLTSVGNISAMSWNGTDEYTGGTLDELRISRTHRSAAWISAQHLSMMDTFITFGSVEVAP